MDSSDEDSLHEGSDGEAADDVMEVKRKDDKNLPSADELRAITLKRDQILEWVQEKYFEETVHLALVRINYHSKYQLAQIVSPIHKK